MLKKVKENKKLEIIQKINTFLEFCFVNDYNDEITQVKIDNLNNIIKNISDYEILVDKKKNYCFMMIDFINKKTLKTILTFQLPNIF